MNYTKQKLLRFFRYNSLVAYIYDLSGVNANESSDFCSAIIYVWISQTTDFVNIEQTNERTKKSRKYVDRNENITHNNKDKILRASELIDDEKIFLSDCFIFIYYFRSVFFLFFFLLFYFFCTSPDRNNNENKFNCLCLWKWRKWKLRSIKYSDFFSFYPSHSLPLASRFFSLSFSVGRSSISIATIIRLCCRRMSECFCVWVCLRCVCVCMWLRVRVNAGVRNVIHATCHK